jgi:hypothetical protein
MQGTDTMQVLCSTYFERPATPPRDVTAQLDRVETSGRGRDRRRLAICETEKFGERPQHGRLTAPRRGKELRPPENHETAAQPPAQESEARAAEGARDGAILLEAVETDRPDHERLRACGGDQVGPARIDLDQQRPLPGRRTREGDLAQAARLFAIEQRGGCATCRGAFDDREVTMGGHDVLSLFERSLD